MPDLPHTRGGVSVTAGRSFHLWQSSPHPWGCFWQHQAGYFQTCIFPTPVGVFLTFSLPLRCFLHLPHTRGGVSWFRPVVEKFGRIFPTPVGVFLGDCARHTLRPNLPHTRGGVSPSAGTIESTTLSSPHPWGCFYAYPASLPVLCIFPTPVGVFPFSGCKLARNPDLPHTRGGVSRLTGQSRPFRRSSPHPWGCFPDERDDFASF